MNDGRGQDYKDLAAVIHFSFKKPFLKGLQ